jgi:NAD-dependent oxidoreductase involved in siderophore biosynthesis
MSVRKTVVVTPAGAGRGEHGVQIAKHLLRLGLHVAFDDLHRHRVEWDLARGEEKAVGGDGLGIWSNGGRRPVRPCSSDRHVTSLPT